MGDEAARGLDSAPPRRVLRHSGDDGRDGGRRVARQDDHRRRHARSARGYGRGRRHGRRPRHPHGLRARGALDVHLHPHRPRRRTHRRARLSRALVARVRRQNGVAHRFHDCRRRDGRDSHVRHLPRRPSFNYVTAVVHADLGDRDGRGLPADASRPSEGPQRAPVLFVRGDRGDPHLGPRHRLEVARRHLHRKLRLRGRHALAPTCDARPRLGELVRALQHALDGVHGPHQRRARVPRVGRSVASDARRSQGVRDLGDFVRGRHGRRVRDVRLVLQGPRAVELRLARYFGFSHESRDCCFDNRLAPADIHVAPRLHAVPRGSRRARRDAFPDVRGGRVDVARRDGYFVSCHPGRWLRRRVERRVGGRVPHLRRAVPHVPQSQGRPAQGQGRGRPVARARRLWFVHRALRYYRDVPLDLHRPPRLEKIREELRMCVLEGLGLRHHHRTIVERWGPHS
mmetsp:Transcript_8203/g.33759  ORF Transcript_8203/g.33759 Transcript_8203/m.33759 type:complete len:457 (+) Transcript_8203:80-1450(+)